MIKHDVIDNKDGVETTLIIHRIISLSVCGIGVVVKSEDGVIDTLKFSAGDDGAKRARLAGDRIQKAISML